MKDKTIDELIEEAKSRGDYIRAGYLTEQKKEMERMSGDQAVDYLKKIFGIKEDE